MRDSPQGIKLHRQEGILEVRWNAENVDKLRVRDIRCDCRCASCVDENTGRRILDVDAVPQDVTITDMKLVGAYSIRFDFSDGHATGLYTWDHLGELAGRTSS